jgi:hypothetical protein
MTTSTTEASTLDLIDPYAGGFTINQETTHNFNVVASTYVFVAIA